MVPGNNLSLNVITNKEMIVDYRKRRTEHTTILIDSLHTDLVSEFNRKCIGDGTHCDY